MMAHYIRKCRFTNEEIDEGCLEIFGDGFYDLHADDRQYLMDEYQRLDQLPSISLVSSELVWKKLYFDEISGEYKFLSVIFRHVF